MKFSLNGTTYPNNSLVTLEDIGEDDSALLCMTNLSACCRAPYGSASGNWFLPDTTRVPSNNNGRLTWDIYRTRGEMAVYMHRRRGGEKGIYYCEIHDSMNVMQTIYIGVYTAGTGEWYCTLYTAVLMLPKSETYVRKVKLILLYYLLNYHTYVSSCLSQLARTYVQKFDTTAIIIEALRPGSNSQSLDEAKHLLARNEPYRDTGFYNGQTSYWLCIQLQSCK